MKRYLLFLLLVLLLPLPAIAETELIDVKIQITDKGADYIIFSWRAEITSDDPISCYLYISFRDTDAFEIHAVFDDLS